MGRLRAPDVRKVSALLKSNGLTYKLGATRDSIAIGLPFSVAVVPGLIPFAEVCFAASMNADYRYIKQKSLASTISETVKNVLAQEGLDDSNTTWWPIYVYDSLEVEGNKVYTADTRLLPVEGAHFAGFAYKLKADSWGGNHEFTGDRVPLSIKQRDFNIKSPRNVSPSQSKFGANQECKGLIVTFKFSFPRKRESTGFGQFTREISRIMSNCQLIMASLTFLLSAMANMSAIKVI